MPKRLDQWVLTPDPNPLLKAVRKAAQFWLCRSSICSVPYKRRMSFQLRPRPSGPGSKARGHLPPKEPEVG
jgi:hypothetical protein